MSPRSLVFAAVLFSSSLLSAETYLSAAGALTLPQGGGDLRRTGGLACRVGTYLSELTAVEGQVGCQENLAALGVGVLTHWAAWELYDRFFGFSAFDPFVTAGVKGWVGGSHGEVGPAVGVGAFYHLDDRWSVRADADLTLGLESRVETVHTLSVGFHYTF